MGDFSFQAAPKPEHVGLIPCQRCSSDAAPEVLCSAAVAVQQRSAALRCAIKPTRTCTIITAIWSFLALQVASMNLIYYLTIVPILSMEL